MKILIVSIVLNLIGRLLKHVKAIKNNYIPFILTVIGCAIFGVCYLIDPTLLNNNINNIFEYGVGASATSVYLYENIHQLIKLLPVNNDVKDILDDIVDKVQEGDEDERTSDDSGSNNDV